MLDLYIEKKEFFATTNPLFRVKGKETFDGYVGYIYPNIKQRTKALGILTSGFNAAAIVGPLIGGWIIDISSWHWIFYINIPIGLLAMLLTAIFY